MKNGRWPRWDELTPWDLGIVEPKRRRARRKPSLAAMVKRAQALGADVTVAPDGSMTLHCGTAAPAPALELNGKGNSWDDLLEMGTRQ